MATKCTAFLFFGFLVGLTGIVSAQASPESILIELLDSDFNEFNLLLDRAQLLYYLQEQTGLAAQQNGGITIFALPDYYVHRDLSPRMRSFLEQSNNADLLRQILLRHVVVGKLGESAWMPGGSTVYSVGKENLKLAKLGGQKLVNDVEVRQVGVVSASDGVVHTVSRFFIPPDVRNMIWSASEEALGQDVRRMSLEKGIVEPVPGAVPPVLPPLLAPAPAPTGAPPLTAREQRLLQALMKFGNYSILIDILQHTNLLRIFQQYPNFNQPLTLFAPDDAAFKGINLTVLREAGNPTIVTVVEYHLLYGIYTFQSLYSAGSVPGGSDLMTVSGEFLPVHTENRSVYLGAYPPGTVLQNSTILRSGQLYVLPISGVLIPPSLSSGPRPHPLSGA